MAEGSIDARVTVEFTMKDVITDSELETLGMTLDDVVRMMIDEEGGPLYGRDNYPKVLR